MTPEQWLLAISAGILAGAVMADLVRRAWEMPARDACGDCREMECTDCPFNSVEPYPEARRV